MKFKISVIYGSVRSSRQGIKAARFITNVLEKKGHDVTLIDPMEYDLPLLNKMYKEYDKENVPSSLEKLASILRDSDAYVIVSGEYNHSIPPALSNLLDYFMEEYFYKPSAIVSYSAGTFGGVRAAMQLRAMLAELGMSSIPSILSIGKVQSQFDNEGNPLDDSWYKRSEEFVEELLWYTEALQNQRGKRLL